jgi:hypothetical protein
VTKFLIYLNMLPHYRVQNNPLPVPILSQMNQVHSFQLYLFHINFNIMYYIQHVIILSLRHLDLPSGLFSSGFLARILYVIQIYLVRATYPAHLILLDLIIIIFSKELKL